MDLFDHQKKAMEFIIGRGGSGALLHEMGLGKTRTAFEIFSRLRYGDDRIRENLSLRMFVVAPLSLLEAAWREDNEKFGYGYSFNNLHKNFSFDPRAYVQAINYESLLARSEKIVKGLLSDGDWLCVLDESSKIKNYQSQITKLLLKIAPLFRYRIIMSGTPAPNSEAEYWPQMQFVAPGILGYSFTAFRSEYFHLQNRYTGAVMAAGRFPTKMAAMEAFKKCDYRITAEKRELLMARLAPVCHVAKKKDCLDLPDQVDEIRIVDLAPDQKTIYKTMEKEFVIQIQNETIAAPVALTKLMKLRQITSGFVYNCTGDALETDNDLAVGSSQGFFDHPGITEKEFTNPKLKELFDVIDQAGDQQVMIWINFHWEQIKICHELFKKFGESVVTLSSLTKDRDGSIRAFKEGRARFLVAHPASAAHGLTFVNCALQIFFSLDYSLERYEQARARTHRAGQVNKCTYVHLVARETIDETILKVLRTKGDAQQIVYETLKKSEKF